MILTGHTDGAYCALLTADGRRAVSGSRDGTVRVWDPETGTCVLPIAAHAHHVQHLAVSADQTNVLSCSMYVRVRDLATGYCVREFAGHTDTVRTVEWSPDGRLMVSASHDRTVRVWEGQTTRSGKFLLAPQAARTDRALPIRVCGHYDDERQQSERQGVNDVARA
jgi:WD40 repeat protein